MKRFFILLFLACFVLASPLRAAETKLPAGATYLDKVDEKFDWGALNFVAGWTEIISEPVDRYKEASSKKDRVLKTALGLGEGVFNAVANITGGFLNALTSPLPQVKIPLPENGIDLKRLTGTDWEESRAIEKKLDPLKTPLKDLTLKETSR
jgi:hypothetical protein